MRILIVEDEVLVAMQIENFLTASGHDVIGIADRRADALDLATRRQPELALVDINLAGGDNGIDLAAELRAQDIQVILATGNCPPSLDSNIALGCLGKPFGEDDITAAIALADAVLSGSAAPSGTPGLRLF